MLTLGRNSSANLNVRLFNNHTAFNASPTSTTVLCSEQPLAIRLGQSFDRNDTDAGLVVATVTWTKPNTPSSLDNSLD